MKQRIKSLLIFFKVYGVFISLVNFKKKYSRKYTVIKTALKYYLFNSFITQIPNHKIRLWYLRRILKIKIGLKTSINMGCFFAGNNISIGNNTVIARDCHLDGRTSDGFIEIKDNVSIAPECYILTMSHMANSESFDAVSKNVILEDFVWLGTRAMVLPGVQIGEGGVLGAASVATKSISPYSICVGSPAKEIGKRNNQLSYQLEYFPYFNTDIC